MYPLLRYALRVPYLTTKSDILGMRFRFKTQDVIGRHIFKLGVHEPSTTRFIMDNLPGGEGAIYVDVGANIGWYSILLDRITDEDATVLAFEPDPLNFKLLEHNIVLNRCAKIRTFDLALSDHDGTGTLHLYSDLNRGKHSMLPIVSKATAEVTTRSLDTLLRDEMIEADRVQLIKMDVEGYELTVLKGMRRVLECRPLVVSELVPAYMEKTGQVVEEYLDLMYSHGYVAHLLTGGGAEEVDRQELLSRRGILSIAWQAT
jgi:FkbM family methyltransferase